MSKKLLIVFCVLVLSLSLMFVGCSFNNNPEDAEPVAGPKTVSGFNNTNESDSGTGVAANDVLGLLIPKIISLTNIAVEDGVITAEDRDEFMDCFHGHVINGPLSLRIVRDTPGLDMTSMQNLPKFDPNVPGMSEEDMEIARQALEIMVNTMTEEEISDIISKAHTGQLSMEDIANQFGITIE